MNAARAYRRLKEVEEQKLANRLALLKLELAKSQKKLSDTQKRTQSISAHREAIMERYKAKLAEQKEREQKIAMAAEHNTRCRERMAILRRANVMQVHQQKKAEAQAIMEVSSRNEQIITRSRELELQRAHEITELIRQQRLAGQEARQEELERKREEARQAFQKRLEEEAQKSRHSESKVQSMEAMEMELIKELEEAQEKQRQAYKELESALVESKKTILETSRACLKENVVDSGMKKTARKKKGKTAKPSAE